MRMQNRLETVIDNEYRDVALLDSTNVVQGVLKWAYYSQEDRLPQKRIPKRHQVRIARAFKDSFHSNDGCDIGREILAQMNTIHRYPQKQIHPALPAAMILLSSYTLSTCRLPFSNESQQEEEQEETLSDVAKRIKNDMNELTKEELAFYTSTIEDALSGYTPLARSGNVTLEWDETDSSSSDYVLYVRERYTKDWHEMGTVFSGNVEYSFSSLPDDLPSVGMYEFGVTTQNSFGTESDMHSSLDPDAIPTGGWYLYWNMTHPLADEANRISTPLLLSHIDSGLTGNVLTEISDLWYHE
jgi:hypothetical protein